MARRSAPNTVNSLVRTREYLTGREVERLMAAARKGSRWGHRDATMILIGYRHGLRASDATSNGLRLSCRRVDCMSAGPRTVRRVSIRCKVTRYALCGAYSASRGIARLHDRTGWADDAQGVSRSVRPDRGARQDAVRGPSAHAASRLRLCACQCRP